MRHKTKLLLLTIFLFLLTVPSVFSISGNIIGNFTFPIQLVERSNPSYTSYPKIYYDVSTNSYYLIYSGENYVAGYDYSNPAYIEKYDESWTLLGTESFNHNNAHYNPSCSDYFTGKKIHECTWNGKIDADTIRIACQTGYRDDFTDCLGYGTWLLDLSSFDVSLESYLDAYPLDDPDTIDGTCKPFHELSISEQNEGATGTNEQVVVHRYDVGSTDKFIRTINLDGTHDGHELPSPSADTYVYDYAVVNYESGSVDCFGTGALGFRGDCGQAVVYVADRDPDIIRELMVNEYATCPSNYGVTSCLFGVLDPNHYHNKIIVDDIQIKRIGEVTGNPEDGWRLLVQTVADDNWYMLFFDNKWNEIPSLRTDIKDHFTPFKDASFTETHHSDQHHVGILTDYFVPTDYDDIPLYSNADWNVSGTVNNYVKITNSQNSSDYVWCNYSHSGASGNAERYTYECDFSSMGGKNVDINWQYNNTGSVTDVDLYIRKFFEVDFPSETTSDEGVMLLTFQANERDETIGGNDLTDKRIYVETEQPPCLCDDWTPEACYFGERKYIRDCDPDGCDVEEYFSTDPTCADEEGCDSGYVCIDDDTYALQLEDCSYTDVTDCSGGTPYCFNGNCVAGCDEGYTCLDSVTRAYVEENCQQSEIINCNSTGYGYCDGGRCHEILRPAFDEDASTLDIIEDMSVGVRGMLAWISPPLFKILLAIAIMLLILGVFGLIAKVGEKAT